MNRARLTRAISWRTGAAAVVANMVGAGIFTTSGFIARDTGSASTMLALWVAGAAVALAGALAYAELGAAIPEAGGEYVYLREAYGPVAAFLSGWTSFFAGFSGAIAASLLAFAGYLAAAVPALGAVDARVIAIAILWALTGVHFAGVRFGARMQNALSAAVVAAIVALVLSGFAIGKGSSANFLSSAPAHGSIAVSLIFVMYAYSGWNAAAYLAGEIVEPERGLPRALAGATACVAALYLALNALYVWAMPVSVMSGVLPVGEKAAAALFGPGAAKAVAAIIALAIVSSASAMVMAAPRIYFAMARDGAFPRMFGAGGGASGPSGAIVLQAGWITLLLLVFGMFERIVIYAGSAIAVFSALTVAAVIVLRMRNADLPRPFRMPAYPWLALGYVAVSIWTVVYTAASRPSEVIFGLLTAIAGLPIYWIVTSGRARSARGSLRDGNGESLVSRAGRAR